MGSNTGTTFLLNRSHYYQETANGEIDLSEDDEEAVEHMVHYFYHLDYCEESNPREQGSKQPSQKLQQARRMRSNIVGLDQAMIEDPLLATASAVNATKLSSDRQPSSNRENAPRSPEPVKKRGASPISDAPCISPRYQSMSRNQGEPGVGPIVNQFTRLSTSDLAMTSDAKRDRTVKEGQVEDSVIGAPDLVTHARVYALAEKYGIKGLKELAREKFEIMSNESWEESGYLEAMHEAYTSTIGSDRGLRNVVVQAFRRNPDLALRDEVQRVVQHTPPLAWDLYRVSSGLPTES